MPTFCTHRVARKFCDFQAIHKNKFPRIKITIFPAKIYSRVNILYLKFATQDITKKSCLSEIVPLSFRNKTVCNELLVLHRVRIPKYCLRVCILLHVLNENENIINAEYWVISENRKN